MTGFDEVMRTEIVYLREIDAGTDNACWIVCNKVDPGAIAFGALSAQAPKRDDAALREVLIEVIGSRTNDFFRSELRRGFNIVIFSDDALAAMRRVSTPAQQVTDEMVERALYANYLKIREEYGLAPMSFEELRAVEEQSGHFQLDKKRMRAALEAALQGEGKQDGTA